MSFFRLLPLETGPGPYNMAADEVLLQGAAKGQAALRCYAWSEATVSLGYFQPAATRLENPRLAGLPFVRRPSGGSTLVHHRELTYCLALPPGSPWEPGQKWMPRMHRIIVKALECLGLVGQLKLAGEPERHGQVLCFQHYTPGDVLCQGRKVVGSAQRKQRQCLMQHGSILLAQSEHTPELPGILELTGASLAWGELVDALVLSFQKETGWQAAPGHWDAQEQLSVRWLIEDRYATSAWNEKR